MATSRPFTYNTSSTVNGTEQIGELAIGVIPLDYSSNPGGLKWWMGPDEDNKYIIGKDVSTKDWPTPVPEGNIGSVRFWATSTENDTQFVDLTNSLGGNSFTTVSSSLSWLSGSGYWSNYPITSFTSSDYLISPTSPGINNAQVQTRMIYSSTNSTIYAEPNIDESYNVQPTPSRIPTSQISLGSNQFLGISSYYFPTGSSDLYRYNNIAYDDSNQKLYASRRPKSLGTFGIVEWDISSNTLTSNVAVLSTNANDSIDSLTYNPSSSLVYTFNTPFGTNNNVLKSYASANLSSTPTTIKSDFASAQLKLYSSTDNTGVVIAYDRSNYYLISGSSIYFTGSGYTGTTSPNYAAYSETSKKFYYVFAGANNGVDNNLRVVSVDVENQTHTIIPYGPQSGGNDQTSPIAWDSNRNCIWVCDKANKLYAIDCSSDTIVKSGITLENGFDPYENAFIIDHDLDKLYASGQDPTFPGSDLQTYQYDLNNFWPI